MVGQAYARDSMAELSVTVTFELAGNDRFRSAGFPIGIWYGDASPAAATTSKAVVRAVGKPTAAAAAPEVHSTLRSVISGCLPCLVDTDGERVCAPASSSSSSSSAVVLAGKGVGGAEPMRRRVPPLVVIDNGATLTLSGGGSEGVPAFSYVVSRTLGKFTAAVYGSRTLFISGPTPNVYRAPTDNDKGGAAASYNARWVQLGLHVATLQVRALDAAVFTESGPGV